MKKRILSLLLCLVLCFGLLPGSTLPQDNSSAPTELVLTGPEMVISSAEDTVLDGTDNMVTYSITVTVIPPEGDDSFSGGGIRPCDPDGNYVGDTIYEGGSTIDNLQSDGINSRLYTVAAVEGYTATLTMKEALGEVNNNTACIIGPDENNTDGVCKFVVAYTKDESNQNNQDNQGNQENQDNQDNSNSGSSVEPSNPEDGNNTPSGEPDNIPAPAESDFAVQALINYTSGFWGEKTGSGSGEPDNSSSLYDVKFVDEAQQVGMYSAYVDVQYWAMESDRENDFRLLLTYATSPEALKYTSVGLDLATTPANGKTLHRHQGRRQFCHQPPAF